MSEGVVGAWRFEFKRIEPGEVLGDVFGVDIVGPKGGFENGARYSSVSGESCKKCAEVAWEAMGDIPEIRDRMKDAGLKKRVMSAAKAVDDGSCEEARVPLEEGGNAKADET